MQFFLVTVQGMTLISMLSFEWLRLAPCPNDYVIDTDNKTVSQIVNEIKSIIDQLEVEVN